MSKRAHLEGAVALVAGATRGGGRGIAQALGEAGATVICTGRTTREHGSARSDYDRPETVDETAEQVTALGGRGVALGVDHLVPEEVAELAARVRRDHGRLDVLVDDIWGAELLKGGPAEWNTPIWEHDLQKGLRILRLAVESHLVTSHHLLPLLIQEPGGLLVEVTDGTRDYNASRYRISVFYDLAKVAVDRIAFAQGHELEAHGACAVSVTPGWLRSEIMLEQFGVDADTWTAACEPGGKAPRGFLVSESPRFLGRGIAALAADPDRARFNQRSLTSFDLACTYDVRDVDGSRPDVWAFMQAEGRGETPDPAAYR
ncbi:MAG: SDR family oxidoreductase [Planctomycetota bacterium]